MKNIKLKKCEICGKGYHYQSGAFSLHIKKEHNIELKDYVLKFEYDVPPKCKCGVCDELPRFERGVFNDYAKGHKDTSKYIELYIKKYGQPTCEICGDNTEFRRKTPMKRCKKCTYKNMDYGFCDPTVQQKIQDVVFEKYGVENVFQIPEIKEIIYSKTWATSGYKEKHSNRIKELWNDLEYRKRMVNIINDRWNMTGYKEKMSDIMKKVCSDPEYRKQMSERAVELWKDPVHRKKTIEGWLKSNKSSSKLHLNIRAELELDNYGFKSEQYVCGYIADELNEETKTIIEINGDYVHANPKIYKKDFEIRLPGSSYLAEEKWESDTFRNNILKDNGYNVIVIWESDNYKKVFKNEYINKKFN